MEGYVERVRKSSFAGLLARIGEAVTSPVAQRCAMAVGVTTTLAVAGYGAYKCSATVNRVAKRAKKWWTNSADPVVPSPTDRAGVYLPESARPGSEERGMSPPKCQALVGYMHDGRFVVVGNAIRIEDWLVIPDHVKCARNGPLELRTFDQKHRFELPEETWDSAEFVDTDLLAVELTQTQWSRAGISRSRLLPSLPETRGCYVSVVGAFAKGTTGTLTHHEVFGRVRYTGSTYQGYSGAAYMAGDLVVGVHTHGGTFNGGFSASYILANLKYARKVRFADGAAIAFEDSEDWFRQQYEAGADMEYDAKWHDLDEVRVRINGRYHIMQRDCVSKVLGSKWQKKMKGGYKGSYNDYDDDYYYENQAGEVKTNPFGASGSLNGKAPSALVDPATTTKSEFSRLRKQLSTAAKQSKQQSSA